MKNIPPTEAQTLLDACPMAMLLTGPDQSIRGCNQAFTALTGLPAADMPAELLAPLLGEATIVSWITPDGDEHWLYVETVALADSGLSARFYEDITEKLRLKKERDALAAELSEHALRDEHIPSLLSRYGILVSTGPLVARSRRYDCPLAVVAMRFEGGGERTPARQKISLLLKDQTRWADLVGCNSEGDFILVLQEAGRDSALQLVEKLSAGLAAMNAAASDPVRASYGIAECAKNDDALSLLERAEAALAEAQDRQDRTAVAL